MNGTNELLSHFNYSWDLCDFVDNDENSRYQVTAQVVDIRILSILMVFFNLDGFLQS